MLRVALLTDSDAFAGTERHMLDLAQGLEARGGDVAVTLCGPAGSPLAERGARAGFPVLTVEKRGRLLDVVAARQLAARLRVGTFDVVHAHNSRTALAAVGAVALAGRGRVVATQHFIEPGHTQTTGPGRALRQAGHWVMNRRLDHVIAISGAVADAVRARGDVPADRLTVVPNGIPAPDPGALADRAAVRAELGVDAEAPLVVCAARLEPEKDVSTLVQAMREVLAACPSARCVIAGEGSQRAALQDEIARTSLAHAVRLPGFRADVLSLIAAGSVFVLPSLAEPFGLVLLEAMALGQPVVATRAGGPREIVADGETGLLVPGAWPSALAVALRSLLDDPARRAAMGARGRLRYEERFTADRMAGDIAAVYQRVFRAAGAAGAAADDLAECHRRQTDPVSP